MTNNSATICALSSAAGRAGVAVVRVSGPAARHMLEALAGGLPTPRTAVLRTIRASQDGQDIDRAIVLWFPGPSSFTGEDTCEFHLHGGRAVVAGVLDALCRLGCLLAEPGEFARRAFENGKIDLTEAEGLADLIDAETEAQRVQAMRQAGGALSRLYDGWRAELISALALIEAAIDFSDEPDVADDALVQAKERLAGLADRIAGHLADGRRGEILREGLRVVLAGAPNVGKSSLLNALARRDVAIVSAEAGTTRDVIEVRLDLVGLPVIVSDTAGIRDASGEVEREGIRRTYAEGRGADVVIWMTEARVPDRTVPAELAGSEGGRVLVALSKADLAGPDQRNAGPEEVALSVVTGEGIPELVARITAMAGDRVGLSEGAVITQARHRRALEDCTSSLQEALRGDFQAPEVVAEDVRRAAYALGRITGRVDAEDVLGEIFGRFCIGK